MCRRSTFFLGVLEETLNDYGRGVQDRPLTVLDIYADATVLMASVIEIEYLSFSKATLQVLCTENSSLKFGGEGTEPSSTELFSAESQAVVSGVDPYCKGVDLRNILRRAQSESSVENFDVIVADQVISKAGLYGTFDEKVPEEESCSQLLGDLWEMLKPGGQLVVGELYFPDWHKDSSPTVNDKRRGESFVQHFDRFDGIKPDKLIELATFKLSRRKDKYRYLYEPRFSVRTRQFDSAKISTAPNYLAKEKETLADGGREFALALERTQKPFDDSRIVETVKKETEEILKSLGTFIKLLRSAETPQAYQRDLNKFLSNSENREDSAYLRMARCLYLQILLEAMNNGLDLSFDRMVFWMAYESRDPEVGIMPAIEPGAPHPLFGYSFGGSYHDTPSNESLTRHWLNIILNTAGFSSNRDPGTPRLLPPSVHEWFVHHAPVVTTSEDRTEDQSLETLTVYVGNPDNRSLALVEGHNSSRRHHRIELQPFKDANEGELWGFQLAEELSKIKSRSGSPYGDQPWPYEKDDPPAEMSTAVSVQAFQAETERLRQQETSGVDLRASFGWIRCGLYSLFLTMCLGERESRFIEPPSWIKFFETVLLEMGYHELVEVIEKAFSDSADYASSDKHIPLSSLTWVTPPSLVSLIGDRPRSLGSILVVSSRLLPVVAFRQLKNQLLNIFVALREGEELIEGEHRANLISLLLSNDAFSHELSKVAQALDDRILLPIETVFQTSAGTAGAAGTWQRPAGTLTISDEDKETVHSWKVSPTPLLLRGLRDILYTWSGSASWVEILALKGERPFAEAFAIILGTAIRVGVAQTYGLYRMKPTDLRSAADIDGMLERVQTEIEELIGTPNVPINLIWRGNAEARLIHSAFARAVIAATSNAIVHMFPQSQKFAVSVSVSNSELHFVVVNSMDPDSPRNPPGGTKRVLENCAQILNNGSMDPTLVYFDPDPEDPGCSWRTEVTALLNPLDESGRVIEWLKPSLQ